MKKRIISISISVIMLLTVLVGCSGKTDTKPSTDTGGTNNTETSEPSEPSEPAKSGGTISVLASSDWVKDPELELAKKFKEETGIEVDYQIVPADQYPSLLMTKLNSGECADIFMNQSGAFDIESQLQISKNAVDLSNEEWVGKFENAVKDQVSVDGSVYGITLWDQGDSYALVYNKKIFSDLGLKEPTSYEDFKSTCQTILDSGITPVFECVSDGWHHVLPFTEVSSAYYESNNNIIDELNENKTTFSEEPMFETVLNQYKEIADLGYWGENFMSNEYNNLGAAMASGEYAMAVNMMGRVDGILESDPTLSESDFGFFPYPYGDNKTIAEMPCGPSKFIFSGGKNIEGAKQYLAFLAEQENLEYLMENEGSFNSLPFDGVTSTYSTEIQEAMAKYKDGAHTVSQVTLKYVNPQWMDIGKDLTSLLMGEMDAKQVLAAIDSRRADQAAAAGDENWK